MQGVIAAQHGARPRGIVAAEQVVLLQRHRPRDGRHAALPGRSQGGSAQRRSADRLVHPQALDFRSVQPVQQRGGKTAVIHHAVKFIPLQLTGGIKEVLADQVSLRVGFLDRGADAVGNLPGYLDFTLPAEHIGHIHPPAVRPERRAQPAAEDSLRPGVHPAAQLRAAVVELRQAPHPQPGLVIIRALMEGEKIRLGGMLVGPGALEPGMHPAAVVGDDIQDVAHAAAVQFLAQFDQGIISAEVWIDVLVVHHIILMVAECSEDRRQVEGVDAQVGQVIKVLGDARQVAAVENDPVVLIGIRLDTPGQGVRPVPSVFILIWLRVGGGIAVGKAVRENLVEDALQHPGRRIVAGEDLEVGRVQRIVIRCAGRGVPPQAVRRLEEEAVVGQRLADGQFRRPVLQVCRGSLPLHFDEGLLAIREDAQAGALDGCSSGRLQANLHALAQGRVGVGDEIRAAVVVQAGQPGGGVG